MSKSIKLTKDPIWTLLRRVTIPASVGSLFQTFYNLVDTWFAGRISAEAIGAIAKSFPIYFTIIAVGVGLGAATNALIGNSIGEKKIRVASLYVAQSLIFAVFLTNPSPICVLDEVDAPLDDANVTRFCNLLTELTKITSTRFIIVTHHALTMSKMNRLYGVTMPEKGISQLVAVDLQKAESMVA